MAVERFRFRTDDDDAEVRNAITLTEIPLQQGVLRADMASAKSILRRKVGQLSYLKTLQSTEMNELGNLEECPICKNPLGHKWAVMACGHCYCCDCVRTLIRYGGVSFSINQSCSSSKELLVVGIRRIWVDLQIPERVWIFSSKNGDEFLRFW